MTIRVAARDDAPAIARLHYEGSLLTTHAHVLDPAARAALRRDQAAMWDQLLARPPAGQRVFVVVGRHVAGFASAGPDPDGTAAGGRIFALFVDPGSWGSGLGTRLLDAAEQHLSRQSRDASLWVVDSNERARRLYERCGWRDDGSEKHKYGIRFVRYSKRLTPGQDHL